MRARLSKTVAPLGRFLALGVAFCFVVCARPTVGVELFAPPHIQKSQPTRSELVFRAHSDLVVLDVTVTDGRRRFVKGLQEQDFVVFEDGVEQHLWFFSEEPLPLDVMLLLDTSSSMHFRLPAARDAALGLVKSLPPGDRVSIVRFDDLLVTVVPIDGDESRREGAIKEASAFGMTRLYDTIDAALTSLARPVRGAVEDRRAAIIVFSDGDDTASETSLEAVRGNAGRSDVAVYAVMPRGGFHPRVVPPLSRKPGSAFRPDALPMLAAETGGTVFNTGSDSEFAPIYKAIGEELHQQYCLAYQSTNQSADGSFRRLEVRMTRPGLNARARAGYYAPVR